MHPIDAVREKTVAHLYLEKLCAIRPAIGNLSKMTGVLRQMKFQVPSHSYEQLQLQELKKNDRQTLAKALYKWLIEQKRCFVVQFVMSGKVDYAVSVDGRHRLVWDNEKDYLIHLNESSPCL